MPKPRVIVEVSPSRVEIAVLRAGAPAEWRCERFGRSEWPSPYTTALPEVAAAIAKLSAEMGATLGPAAIIYSAPGSVTMLTSCSTSLRAAESEQAAVLAMANVADFPIDDAPSDTCTLLIDGRARRAPETDDNEAEPRPTAQQHILAAADAEERIAALCRAMEGAGLLVDRLIPADAVALADAVRLACCGKIPDEISAIVWFGEHSTQLAVGSPGRLLLVRTIATGLEDLVEALGRPLRPREGGSSASSPISLAHDSARTLLLSAGVPEPHAPIPAYPTLDGSSLLPHLQPVLQRLTVEVKQSLRFGVAEADRSNIVLRVAGPGAAMPGLREAIARAAGFPHEPDSELERSADALDSSTGGLIAALARCGSLEIALAPADVRRAHRAGRLRRALLVGAGLALAFVGYEAADAQLSLRADRAALAQLSAAVHSAEGPLAVRRQALAARAALAGAEDRLRKALGQSPDWSATLCVLAENTPPEVRLSAMDIRHDGPKSTLAVRGLIRFEESPDPAALIHAYVQKLEAIPIIESVRLGATQRAVLAGHDSQTFELSLGAVPMPARIGEPGALAAHAAEAP